jgi:hypothetical protein
MSLAIEILILILNIIILSCVIYLIYLIHFKKEKYVSIYPNIYKDIDNKIYNPEDKLPTIPGNYSIYTNPFYTETDAFIYSLSKGGFLLNSISNLPPNKVVTLIFGDKIQTGFRINIQVNNDGILYFNDKLEGLPVGLINDISNIYLLLERNEKYNTIFNYENIPLYNNNKPYNTPIENYTVLKDTDKNNYKLSYEMLLEATGVCAPCLDTELKPKVNVTFKETIKIVINNEKTDFFPLSSNGSDFCKKICPDNGK